MIEVKLIDKLYHDLLNAQLDKNWGKVAKIQLEINRLELKELTEDSVVRFPELLRALRESELAEGESKVEEDLPHLRDHEGTV